MQYLLYWCLGSYCAALINSVSALLSRGPWSLGGQCYISVIRQGLWGNGLNLPLHALPRYVKQP